MNAITLTADELSGIKNRQVQRLIAGKLETALNQALITLKADPKATQVESVKAYLELLDKVNATKSKPVKRKKKTTA